MNRGASWDTIRSSSGFYEYIFQRPSSFVRYNWRFFVDLSKKRLVLYQLPVFHKNVFYSKARRLMVDIARQRAKWFFLLKVFVGVLLSCFQSVFQRELELLNSVDILSLYGAFGILLVGFERFLLSYLFWVIGGQLIENQPLLRQIYKEPPILSRDNLAKKRKCHVRYGPP